jgi:hypothetical protein
MNLYLISQSEATGYDVYDSAVVAAYSEEDASTINPEGGAWGDGYGAWASSPTNVQAILIGTAFTPRGIILSSFNAG